jgi:hypothetical protein
MGAASTLLGRALKEGEHEKRHLFVTPAWSTPIGSISEYNEFICF